MPTARVPVVLALLGAVVVLAVVVERADGGSPPRSPGTVSRAAPLHPPFPSPPRVDRDDATAVEAQEARPVQLGMPVAAAYRPGTPQRALAAFLVAWRQRAWDRMVHWTGLGWQRRTLAADPGAVLRERLGSAYLRGASFGSGRAGRNTRTFVVELAYRTLSPRLRRATTRILLVFDGQGRWGVEPSSVPRLPR